MKAGPMDVYTEAAQSGRKTASQRDRAEKLGLAAMLNKGKRRELSYLFAVVNPAISHNHIQLFYNDNGMVVGYAIWALLSDEMHHRMIANPSTRLHLSEWNEGDHLWVLDVTAPYGHFRDIMKHLITHTFCAHDTGYYSRRVRNRQVFLELHRPS